MWDVTLDGQGPEEGYMMSRGAKWEYLKVIHGRYRQTPRAGKGPILDEFCRTTGYHRKYALRLLSGPPPGAERPARQRRPATYTPAVIQALTAIWEAAGYPWSVRLKALIPLWLPWARRRWRLSATVCQQLRAISPRQIDRRLAPDQAAAQDPALWPDQARHSPQTPHPREDRSLGCEGGPASPSWTWWPMRAIGRMGSSPIR